MDLYNVPFVVPVAAKTVTTLLTLLIANSARPRELPSPVVSVLVNVGDASYLLAHYGSSSGGFSEVWVIHDFALTTIPNTENGHRLCSWALFGPAQAIPDGSTTIGLFSSALAALGMLRCFRRS